MEVLIYGSFTGKNLKKIYGSGNNAVHALDGADLGVKKGEFVAIVGTSGSRQIHAADMLGRAGSPYKRHSHGGRTGYFLSRRRRSADHLPAAGKSALCSTHIILFRC